jgi:hypothetical protein
MLVHILFMEDEKCIEIIQHSSLIRWIIVAIPRRSIDMGIIQW